LQAVISAAQVREKSANVYIPIPDATQLIDYYSQLYNRPFRQPKSLIRFSSLVEDSVGTPYCLDEVDDAWLREFSNRMDDGEDGSVETISPDQFEILISELERISEAKQKDVSF
jgi:enhancer of polycomb-like protein